MEISIFAVIKQVGIFIICAQMIMHFKAADKYAKYIRLLISFMVLVQMVVPIFELIWDYDAEQFWKNVKKYEVSLEESINAVKITDVLNEEKMNNSMIEEVKSRINNTNTGESQNSETEIQPETEAGKPQADGTPKEKNKVEEVEKIVIGVNINDG